MSDEMLHVTTVVGTRPEAIKLAPVVQRLQASPGATVRVIATAQHRELLDQVLELFDIVPDVDLGLMKPGQTLPDLTANAVRALDAALADAPTDVVLVQGDTTTCMVGALAAFYRHTQVAHLEAGLRSGDRWAPYPEEMNRRLTSQLADIHLAPTNEARANLLADGVPEQAVVVTGNTVIDALHHVLDQGRTHPPAAAPWLAEDDRRMVLVTAHRRESWGDGMARIADALATIARRRPDTLIVCALHMNPVVREPLLAAVGGLRNVVMLEPQDYSSFSWLLQRCDLVLSDSGGIQEEAPALGKPVLVMRDNTERPEGVQAGTARLVGTDRQAIVREVGTLLDDAAAYERMARAINPYGDGHAARRTVDALLHFCRALPRPDDFPAAA